MKKILSLILFISAFQQAFAQQDILVSQYMFNPLLLNPAYAGSKEYMQATLLYRKQWVNVKGAPETQVATIHGPWGLTSFGWGFTLSHDRIGVTDRTEASISAAYHLKLSEKMKLGVGIKGGGDFYSYDNEALKYWDHDDLLFAEDHTKGFEPNIGAGAYLYSEKFYFGLSVPTIINDNPPDSLALSAPDLVEHHVRHYYATAGVVIPVSGEEVIAKPSILARYVPNAPTQFDFNLNFLFSKLLWVGGSYRTGDSFVAILELQLTNKLRLGYSYDVTTSKLKDYSAGSHEIMIGYDFGYDIDKIKTPRYF
jgi:type IX secretion system PorP/SprF family membrane protein